MASDQNTSLPDFVSGQPSGRKDHPELARFSVALALLVFLSMIGIILVHWLRSTPPDAMVQVSGDERQSGAVVEVIDNMSPDRTPIPQTLSPGNKYTARFPLPPGDYTLKVSRGNTERQFNLVLRESDGWIYDLTKEPAFAGSTTQPVPALDGVLDRTLDIK